MGGCVSIQISCDQLINNACNCLSRKRDYVHGLEYNLAALQRALEGIEQIREDLLRKIGVEERKGLQRLSVVQGWVSKVEEVVTRVNELLKMRSVQVQRLCFCGYCSKNLVSSYRYGKRVMEMVEEVENLRSQGDFTVVAERVVASRVEERPTRPMVAIESMLESAWNRLMEDEIGILGLHGMGGVGKTTLLSLINNRFSRVGGEFDIVIWIVVSKDLQIQKIQDEIWEKLRSDKENWIQKTENRKASDIYNVLKHKRFVLLLDDIWSKVDLTKVGVPFPSRENRCKIVFTTRLKEICGRMEVDSDMEVRCLAPDDAWDFFTKKVGEITLGSHPEIPKLARTVAKKCHGLPLALNVIGETMAYKRTVQEWRLAIDVLTSSAAEFSGMEDEILPILKYSYDNLKREQLKLCFQYCALFPEDYNMSKEELVDFWIGEGFIDGNKGRAENQGYDIIGSLVRACLLMEEDEETVRMHDVVREMALWIASDFGEQKDNYIAQAGFGLSRIPEIKKWKGARRVSLMVNHIKSILDTPESPQLVTLFLQKNRLDNLSGVFFQIMPMLVVLDLSGNASLDHIPEEISVCVSLQYLSLSRTGIKLFPLVLLKLEKLKCLNLEYTQMAERIFSISGLWNLQVLRLFCSGFKGDPGVVGELQLLENLQILTLNLGLVSVLKQFLRAERLARCTRVLRIENLDRQLSEISFVTCMDSLRELYLEHSDISEIKVERRERVLPLHSPSSPFFPNLSNVSIVSCKGLRDLTWLLFAPNLTVLRVRSASELEEIIDKEISEQQSVIPFLKLKELRLRNNLKLKSIHRSPLPFPCLQNIYVNRCPKLRKFPFDSTSVMRDDLVIELSQDILHRLDWEDDTTAFRFSKAVQPIWHNNIDGVSSEPKKKITT